MDHDLVFCREEGTPWPPDYVSRRFKAIAKAAGLPVIKLHEGDPLGLPGSAPDTVITEVTGFLARGHTWDLSDPAAPIWVDQDDTATGPGVMEGRCPSCITQCSIGRLGGGVLLVLEHEDGCRWLAGVLAGAR